MKFVNPVAFFRIGYLVLLLEACGNARGATPSLDWVKTAPAYYYLGAGITADLQGNAFWCGFAAGQPIGGTPVSRIGMFLAKLNGLGEMQWLRVIDAEQIYTPAIAVDGASNIVVMAGFKGLNVSGSILTGEFVTKLNSDGTRFLWKQQFLTGVIGYPHSLALDPFGNYFGAGSFDLEAFLENLYVEGRHDSLLLKLTPEGTLGWINRGGSVDVDLALAVSADRAGNAYMGGTFGAQADFGPFLTTAEKGGYVAKYRPDGSVAWLQTLKGPGNPVSINATAILPDGQLAVLGLFEKAATFGTNVLAGIDGYTTPFIAKIDGGTGTVLSVQVLDIRVVAGEPDAQLNFYMASTGGGGLRIAGYFTGNSTFGSTALVSKGGTDIFVAALGAAGEPLWIRTVASTLDDRPTGLAYDYRGHTFLGGVFSGASADFNGEEMAAQIALGATTFIAKIDDGVIDGGSPSGPVINDPPISQQAYTGVNVVFNVGVSSTSPVQYQWFFNNVPLPNQTNSTLALKSVNVSKAGFYFLEARNADGLVRSDQVELSIAGTLPVSVTTIAGTNIAGYKDGIGIEARFNQPNSPALTTAGEIIVPDIDNTIRIIESNGTVRTLAGSTNAGFTNGPGSKALFNAPLSVTIGAGGDVFVADTGNNVIRRISALSDRTVTTYAGSGLAGYKDGNASEARFNFPDDLAFDSKGNLFVTEFTNHTVRKITPAGFVSTFAGNGTRGYMNGNGTNALFNMPAGIAIDSADNIYVTEWSGERIRRITSAGIVTTVAGTGRAGYLDGQGTSAAWLNTPDGITVDPAGNLYFTEFANHSVRKVDKNGVVTTLAGLGTAGFQDGDRNRALFQSPGGIVWHPDGSLIIADTFNHAIRKLTLATNSIPNSPTLSVQLHPGITVHGPVGKTYRIEAADSATTPLAWTTIGIVSLTEPVELFFDPQPATRTQRLYRATEVP